MMSYLYSKKLPTREASVITKLVTLVLLVSIIALALPIVGSSAVNAVAASPPFTVTYNYNGATESIGAQRFDFKYANGPMPHSKLMKSIELYGTKVIPMVREILSESKVTV